MNGSWLKANRAPGRGPALLCSTTRPLPIPHAPLRQEPRIINHLQSIHELIDYLVIHRLINGHK